jgi:hypothetical protein
MVTARRNPRKISRTFQVILDARWGAMQRPGKQEIRTSTSVIFFLPL